MRTTLLLVAAATISTFTPASAQRASQHGVVSQTVNETEIRLEYDRPVARGRELFGELVEWDAIWTPGANRATWIEFSGPVTINGHKVPEGRYAIWMVPQGDRPWEVIFVSEWDTHHGMFPFDSEVLRIEVASEQGAHMEALAYYFPVVGPYEATLRMHWGSTIVPLQISVSR